MLTPETLRGLEKELDDTGHIAKACNGIVRHASAWSHDRQRIEELERALGSIRDRANRIASGAVECTAFSAADYDIQVVDAALAGKQSDAT